MGATAAQAAWVKQILLLDAQPDGGGGAAAVLPVWTAAKDEADRQLVALQAAFRKHGGAPGQEIADKGLAGFVDNMQVRLVAALMDVDGAAGERRDAARAKAAKAASAFRAALAANPAIPLLERNPWVAFDLRGAVDGALGRIEAMLGAGA